jgi:hypothetical protein
VIRLVANANNMGIIATVNRAVRLAKGDYLYIPSANDLVLPGFFERSLALLDRFPEAAMSCTDGRSVDLLRSGREWDMTTGWLDFPGYLSPESLADAIRTRIVASMPLSPSCIMKRASLPEGDIWKPELAAYCDWYLYQTLMFRHGCCFIPEKLVAPRWHANSYCATVKRNRHLYRQVFSKALALLASPGYEDVAKLAIRGRTLTAFELSVLTPFNAASVLRSLENKNSQARALFWHVTIEYCRLLLLSGPLALTRLASPGAYYLKNIWDRAFARAFHLYDRLRSAGRKQASSP